MKNEELVRKYRNGDKQALEELINNNIGIIKKLANKFNNINDILEIDDLVQIGYVALIEAANGYEIDNVDSVKFITYAFSIIKNRIMNTVNGRTSKDVKNNNFYKEFESINKSAKSEYSNKELIDFIDSNDSSITDIEDKIYFEQLRKELEETMDKINTLEEREILKLIYGWDIEIMNLREAAELLSLSFKYATSLREKGIRKLRNSIWSRTRGEIYAYELFGFASYEYTYRSVEKKIDRELEHRYWESKLYAHKECI